MGCWRLSVMRKLQDLGEEPRGRPHLHLHWRGAGPFLEDSFSSALIHRARCPSHGPRKSSLICLVKGGRDVIL